MISERKYKVGDVVRTLVDTDYAGVELFPKGTIGTIVNIDCKDRHPFTVAADGEYWHYSAIMIEPVDEDGTPKQEPCEDWCDVPSDEMTLDEEIKHAEEVMRSQLAEWLKELKQLKEGTKMTKEQKGKILKALADDRNNYARECERRIAAENGKITGADYMLQRFLDVLRTEVESNEREGQE